MPGEEEGAAQNAAELLNNQNRQLSSNRIKDALRQHARTIGTCDGQERGELRKWISGVDQASVWVEGADDKAVIEMLAPLLAGPLATFLTQLKKRADLAKTPLTWEGIKAEIKKTFLAINEEDLLREAVHKVVQREYEEVQAYTQRFKEALRLGYTDTEQAVSVIKTQLIQRFVDGLRDHNLRRDVYREEPDDLEKAYTAAAKAERALSRANAGGPPQLPPLQSSREEEPMEIGAAGGEPGLAEALRRMEKRFEALELRLSRPSRPQRDWRPGTPKNIQCYSCGKFGHVARKCLSRKDDRRPVRPPKPAPSKN